MISKELLSAVLNIEHILKVRQSANVIRVVDAKSHCGAVPINIHELAHKCKEWAKSEGYYILSGYDDTDISEAIINHTYSGAGCYCDESVKADTESEAIFQACNYILKELSNK